MKVRPAALVDAEVWLGLRHALWPDGSLEAHRQDIDRYFAGDRREPAEVLLAVADDGAFLGVVELSIRNIADGCSSDRVGYLEGWYVVPQFRRQGIGRALVAAGEAWAFAQGCIEFASDSEIDNAVSYAAHLQLGFEETGRVHTYRKSLIG